MKRTDNQNASYAQMGMAATLPGLIRALEIVQQHVDELQAQLGQRQPAGKKLGRTSKADLEQRAQLDVTNLLGAKSGWPADPEERRAEALRRRAVAAAKRNPATPKKLHPRDAEHPDHTKWLRTMRRAQRKSWDAMSATERESRIAKAVAGRGQKLKRLQAVAA